MLAKPRNNRTLGAERERRSQVKLRKRVESRQAGDRTRGSRTQGFAAADRLRGGQESLNAVAEELAHGGLASRATHDSQVRTWCAIGRRAGIEPFPLTKVTVGVILRCLKDGGYRSPEQYLSLGGEAPSHGIQVRSDRCGCRAGHERHASQRHPQHG